MDSWISSAGVALEHRIVHIEHCVLSLCLFRALTCGLRVNYSKYGRNGAIYTAENNHGECRTRIISNLILSVLPLQCLAVQTCAHKSSYTKFCFPGTIGTCALPSLDHHRHPHSLQFCSHYMENSKIHRRLRFVVKSDNGKPN